MPTVTAYGVSHANGSFERLDLERRELAPNDVLIKIAYAGICHSDIHTIREEWGGIHYPMIPGHEIAGIVEAIGSTDPRRARASMEAHIGAMTTLVENFARERPELFYP